MRWLFTIDIRKYLGDDESQEAMLSAAAGISAECGKLPIVSSTLAKKLGELGKAAEIGNLAWFNASLSELWDWFDQHRVFVKL